MNRLAKHRNQLSDGLNYTTLINLLKKIHREIDPIIKAKENFINGRADWEHNYHLNPLDSRYINPFNKGEIEPDLTKENCPGIKLGECLRNAMFGRAREHSLQF